MICRFKAPAPPAALAISAMPHVSYHGHTTGPSRASVRRLTPRASGPDRRSERTSSQIAVAAATARPAVRETAVQVDWCAPSPRALVRCERPRPTAVAGSSHDTTLPGVTAAWIQPHPSSPTALTAASTRAASATYPAIRATLRAGSWSSLAHQPRKTTASSAGAFTSAPRAHETTPSNG